MKKTKAIVALISIISTLSLSGCTTYGVDNNTWNRLTPQEQEIAMQNYYRNQAQQQQQQAEINKINAQNAPYTDAIAALSDLTKKHGNHQHCITDNYDQTVCGYHCYVDQFGNGHCSQQ